jgi:magnesium-transporting ATPase (P-type)
MGIGKVLTGRIRKTLFAEAEKRLKEFGRNELPEKVTPSWLVFLKQMWAPMPIMIWCEGSSSVFLHFNS